MISRLNRLISHAVPSTHYEMAVVIWNESGMKESKVINEYLTKCASWETYELDNR